MTPPKNRNKKEEEEQEIEAGSFMNPARNRRQGDEESTSLWLITFTDIMALMLTFFVLLYSMSVPKEEEWEQITSAVQNQFSKTFSSQAFSGQQDTINIDKIDFSKAQSLTYLESVLSNAIGRDQRLQNIQLIPQRDHLIVSVPEELLFPAGSATVSEKGGQVLASLGNTMARIRNRIEVIGHSDPDPIEKTGGEFGSNWDLSLARAGAVAGILEESGYQRSIILRGYSSARYDDLPDTMSEDERLSLARRVDIVIMEDDGSQRLFMGFE